MTIKKSVNKGKSIMKKFLILSLLLITPFVFSKEEKKCSTKILNKVRKEGELISCKTYTQKNGLEYLALLEIFKNDDEEWEARVSHFQKEKGSKYKTLYVVEDLGEVFLPLKNDSFISIVDVNKDGHKDIIFRTLRTPTSAIYMHSFKSKDSKITNLGMIETGLKELEFTPFIIAEIGDLINLEEGKVELISSEGKKSSYKWKDTAFSIENK